MTLSEITSIITEQGESFTTSYHNNKNYTKSWTSVKLSDGNLFAKQEATSNGNGAYYFCNEFEDSKGKI